MTVDVKGSAPLWMKIKDLADGVTYNFRIRAKTLTFGPEVEANITTGPGEGKGWPLCRSSLVSDTLFTAWSVLQQRPFLHSLMAGMWLRS